MSQFQIYRGNQIPGCPSPLSSWGWVEIHELRASLLGCDWDPAERLLVVFGPLTKDLSRHHCEVVTIQLFARIVGDAHGRDRELELMSFVPAGWAKDVDRAWTAGVRFLRVEPGQGYIPNPEVYSSPDNCWTTGADGTEALGFGSSRLSNADGEEIFEDPIPYR